jgi:phage terminase Nu1 subunit (DNA packaging protein)
MSYQEARRQREMYQAQLLRVQYDLQSGEVVRVADVARMLGEQCARIRTKLLAIPSSCAARVARMTTPAEVDAALSAAIVDALRELTADQVP